MNTRRTELNITDRVTIMIAGRGGLHQAEVIRLRPDGAPYLHVLDETGWPILKPGDYILAGVLGGPSDQ